MPSKSKSQQRFFGMVRACQKKGKCPSSEVSKVAKEISKKDADDFAKTKHKGLPNKVKKKKKKTNKFSDWYKKRELKEYAINKDMRPPAEGKKIISDRNSDKALDKLKVPEKKSIEK